MLSILTSIITIINVLVYIYVIYVVFKKKGKSQADKRFFLLVFFSFCWVLISYIQGLNTSFYPFLVYLNYSTAILIAGVLVSFAFHYPQQNRHLSFVKEICLQIPAFVFFVLSFTKLVVAPVSYQLTIIGPIYKCYLLVLILYFIILGGGILIWKYRHIAGIDKLRLRYFLLGYFFAIIILLGESIYFNLVSSLDVSLDRLIFNSSIIFSSLSVYSMVKYRFLDIRIVIRRGLVKFTSLVLLFGIYLFFILFVRDSLSKELKNEQTFVLGVVVLIIVASFEQIKKIIYSLINRIFDMRNQKADQIRKKTILISKSRETYDNLLLSISSLLKDFFETGDVEFIDLSNSFFIGKPDVEAYLRSTGKILIPEELSYRYDEGEKFFYMHRELQKTSFSVLIPIGQGPLFVGCFALGRRKKGKVYSVQEIHELRKMQDQFTEALLNARLYHQAITRIKI